MLGRYRPRARLVIAPVVATALLAAVLAVLKLKQLPSWLSWLPPWAIAAAVAVLGVAVVVVDQWTVRRHAAADRERRAVELLQKHLGRQRSLPRIGERGARALELGVHPALPLDHAVEPAGTGVTISWPWPWQWWRRVSGAGSSRAALDPQVPTFIDRDLGAEVGAWMRTARADGGFLVLVGDSSVGKTRLLYETARKVLPEFRVLAPDLGDGGLLNEVAAATFPLPKLIVWLDELQRFLPGPYFIPGESAGYTPITAAAVRKLRAVDSPLIILGTLWPEYAWQLRTTERDPATGGQRPRYPQATDILSAGVHDLRLSTFSEAERTTAAALAYRDARLATAVADRNFNVTEALAGAPELLHRYEKATAGQQAVIHAAADARRLGVQGALTIDLLRAAARGYLASLEPDDAWFDHALGELTSRSRRTDAASAPLLEVYTADRRAVAGYTVADYLLQHLTGTRRSSRLTAVTWQAFTEHVHNPDDRNRLAYSARSRLLYQQAEALFTHSIGLAELFGQQGRVDEQIATLRQLADDGDRYAADELTNLLAQRGDDEAIVILRQRADAGDSYATGHLAYLLAERGDMDGGIAVLRRFADAGDREAAEKLTNLLFDRGYVDEAIEFVRQRVDAGDEYAARRLADLLAQRGDVDEAIEVLRQLADAGDDHATEQLAHQLADQHRFGGLRQRADAGDRYAAEQLAYLLAEFAEEGDEGEQGEAIAHLRQRADIGDPYAAEQLADVLVRRGDDEAIAILRQRTDAGDRYATERLPYLLAKRDCVEEAIAILRRRADAGDRYATEQMADLFAERGDVGEAIAVLRPRADAGDEDAAEQLVRLLEKRGDVEEAIAVLRLRVAAGYGYATHRIAELLEKRGDVEEAIAVLRPRADAGDDLAAIQIATMLAKRGDVDEAIAVLRPRADAGDSVVAAEQIADLLAERGDVEGLRLRIDAGDYHAAARLSRLLAERGDQEQVARLRRHGFQPEGPVE